MALKSRNFVSALMCLLSAACAARAAFTIEPAIVTFLADQGEKTAFLELVHTGGGPAAIQFSVFDRVLNMDGAVVKESRNKSPDFIVHPSEVILYPGERASVQLQYRGKGKITEDRAYMVYSQELPINVEEDESGLSVSVKMLTNYYSVVIFETNKPAKLAFVSSRVIGGGRIEVVVENKGKGRVHMDSFSLVVDGRLVRDYSGKSNTIMPGTQRRFTFEWPRAVTAKEVKFGY